MSQSVRQSATKGDLLAAAVKYVRKRGNIFQYERRVPEKVKRESAHYAVHFGSKALFRRSLRTSDTLQMHAACVAVHLEFEGKLAAIAASSTSGVPVAMDHATQAARRKVTQSDLDEIAERYRLLTVSPLEKAHIMADASTSHAEEYDRLIYNLELDAEKEETALAARGTGDGTFDTPAEIAAWVVSNDGWDAPAGSQAFGAIAGAIRSGIRRGRDEAQALLTGKATPRLHTVSKGDHAQPLTLGRAVSDYLVRMKLPVRTESEVKSSLHLFEGLIGNKRLDAITRRDFQNYAEHLAQQTIGGKTPGSITRPASRATVKKRIGLLRAVINHAIARDEFCGPNPASGINVDAYVARPNRSIMPQKRRFTVEEMNLIFQYPWFTGCVSASQIHKPGEYRLRGSEYWVPVMATFTGCRASELGGLMLSEVMLDGSFPHLVIRDNKYRRTKKGHARKVPLLDQFVEFGFASYVEGVRQTGADRLFPDWEPPAGKGTIRNDDKNWSNGRVIRSFNRTVVPATLGDRLSPDARREVTFHGFRGAFKALLGSAEYKLHPNLINEVAGHAKSEMDARYVGEISIEDTYPAIRACRYSGLIIPKLVEF